MYKFKNSNKSDLGNKSNFESIIQSLSNDYEEFKNVKYFGDQSLENSKRWLESGFNDGVGEAMSSCALRGEVDKLNLYFQYGLRPSHDDVRVALSYGHKEIAELAFALGNTGAHNEYGANTNIIDILCKYGKLDDPKFAFSLTDDPEKFSTYFHYDKKRLKHNEALGFFDKLNKDGFSVKKLEFLQDNGLQLNWIEYGNFVGKTKYVTQIPDLYELLKKQEGYDLVNSSFNFCNAAIAEYAKTNGGWEILSPVITDALNSGMRPFQMNYSGYSLLHLIGECPFVGREFIELCVNKGASLGQQSRFGQTPICCAIEDGNYALAERMIDVAFQLEPHALLTPVKDKGNLHTEIARKASRSSDDEPLKLLSKLLSFGIGADFADRKGVTIESIADQSNNQKFKALIASHYAKIAAEQTILDIRRSCKLN